MKRAGALESGVTLAETLIVMGIVSAVVLLGVTVSSGSRAGTRSQTMAQVLGLFNRAHNLASANGATIQVVPSTSGSGSDITIYDAFSGGTVVAMTTTSEKIGGYCVGSGCGNGIVLNSFWLRVRRDGSFIGDAGNGDVGATSVTIGIDEGGGHVLQGYTLDPSDLHARPATVP